MPADLHDIFLLRKKKKLTHARVILFTFIALEVEGVITALCWRYEENVDGEVRELSMVNYITS